MLVLRDANADFDGDALNGIMLIEGDAARAYHILHPSHRILSSNAPVVDTNISLPDQTFVDLNNYLASLVE